MPDSMLHADLPRDLKYVDDSQPGIRRKKVGSKFKYYNTRGEHITEPDEIKRLDALAVPPAYTEVWICADPRGHLQATGRDARGRKQYLYHPRWREVRDSNKYSQLTVFGKALPKLRKQLDAHIAKPKLSREKVLATVVMLLDTTLIRVGNSQYVKENKSYGLTTLRNRHVDILGSEIRFQFRGKSGVEHQVSVRDRRLARAVKRCQELPGQNLFQYLDEEGQRHNVSSSDVNAYLHSVTGVELSAKDFRTWAATVMALSALRELEWQPESRAKSHVVAVVKDVARHLGNTPAVCRNCYIHPAVPQQFSRGNLAKLPKPRARKGLNAEETALLLFLARYQNQGQ